MQDMSEAVTILRGQGLDVRISADEKGKRYYVGGPDCGYILRGNDLIGLQREGKLNLDGIRALDKQIRNELQAGSHGQFAI